MTCIMMIALSGGSVGDDSVVSMSSMMDVGFTYASATKKLFKLDNCMIYD